MIDPLLPEELAHVGQWFWRSKGQRRWMPCPKLNNWGMKSGLKLRWKRGRFYVHENGGMEFAYRWGRY